tara:strand:- start:3279 stop:3497 length:219 start_codon:yes stop_codon:yes gene_type:complete
MVLVFTSPKVIVIVKATSLMHYRFAVVLAQQMLMRTVFVTVSKRVARFLLPATTTQWLKMMMGLVNSSALDV